jgi:restriction endonuclease Mrr
MTFTEAAAQVLRLVGKPLHYKEITDVAIEKEFLSHVGKSPEVTMGARLAALVKKGDRENPLVRIKPGVFALREWDDAQIEKGLNDRTPALQIAKRADKQRAASAPGDDDSMAPAVPGASPSQTALQALDDEEDEVLDDDEKERAELAATAGELFSAEEDDDDPIFGSEEEPESDGENGAAAQDNGGAGGRGRRRRRRRGRGGRGGNGPERDDDDLPSYTVADAPVAALADAGEGQAAEGEQRADEPNRDRDRGDRGDRERERGDRGDRGDRDRGERGDRDRGEERTGSGPGEELSGAALADLAEAALGPFQRQGNAPLRQVAEAIQRRGRGGADVQQVLSAVAAAVRADNLRRESAGQRPRFRVNNGRVALTEWLLDGEALRIERDLQGLAQRYRDAVRRSFLRRLSELPQRAFNELVQLVLERLGYSNIKSVRRAGSHQSEQHFSARFSGGNGDGAVAIVIRRDGRDLGRERVTELRGALHHYGPASSGVLVTTGQALGGAREEAQALGAAPVKLIDGAMLGRLADEQGIGLMHSGLRLPFLDADLFDSLKNQG